MSDRPDPWRKLLRWLQWGSVVSGIFVAMLLVAERRGHRANLAHQIRTQNQLKQAAAAAHIGQYFADIHLCLRLFSLSPDVKRMHEGSEAFLRMIFEANYAQHNLSEVYVLKRDFDGSARPFMTFELGDDHDDVETIHSAEREEAEYAMQVSHIRRLADDPTIELLVSEPVPLCVGEAGLVLSVPVRDGGEFLGIVSGMVRSSVISDVMEQGSLGNLLHLTNERGDRFECHDFNETIDHWLADRFEHETVAEFFGRHVDSFQAGRYTGLWSTVDLADDQTWYLSLLYDESVLMAEVAPNNALGVWGASLGVLLHAAGIVVLCSVVLALRAARRRAEDRSLALAESDARTHAIVDAAAEGFITINGDGLIESANQAAVRLFGYEADDLIGKNVNLLMPSPLREEHTDYIHRYLADRVPRIIGVGREVEGIRQDGSTVPLEIAVSEVRLPDKTVFTGVIRDISERKSAEHAIRESEERFRAIAQYTYDWENWIGPEGAILWINPGVERVTGYSVEECFAMPGFPWPLVHEGDRGIVNGWLEAAVTNQSSGNDLTFRIRRKNGQIRWVAVSWQPISSADGSCLGHRSSVRDITERKHAEEAALQRQNELAHVTRLSTMGEMATELAHELNQPLATVVNYVQACIEQIRSGDPNSDELLDHLNNASAQARRAGRIVERTRVFVRKQEIRKKKADINALVRDAVELVRGGMPQDNVGLRTELAEELPSVVVEPIQIEQVVVNLIRNGLDAMAGRDCDSAELLVQTTLNEHGHVELSVCDRGPGLSPTELGRAFEPFFSTKPDGMGMGLPISRSIVEEHGGRLQASRNRHGGSTFHFTLPVEDGGQ